MNWLSSLPAGVLVLGWLGLALVVAALGRLGVRVLVPTEERDQVPQIASPLMPAVLAGLALIFNAGALTFRSGLRTALLAVGLASVVGLSLALLFSISGPWRGPLVVSGHPLDAIIRDLETGLFAG